MRIFRGFHQTGMAPACALTIGNFDGVHRGHQAMLALLRSEARHRGVPSCVMTFEPHPRDYFAAVARKPALAPARIATLRRQRLPGKEIAAIVGVSPATVSRTLPGRTGERESVAA